MTDRATMNEHPETASRGESGAHVYATVLAVALLIGLGLAVYIAIYRQEIIAIVTQSPT